MDDYLRKTDSRYEKTLLSTMFIQEHEKGYTYKNGDVRIYCEFSHGSALWNVYMYIQWVLIPKNCYKKGGIQCFCFACHKYFDHNSKVSTVSGMHNTDTYGINSSGLDGHMDTNTYFMQYARFEANMSHAGRNPSSPGKSTRHYRHKIFTLKSYEVLLNALSYIGIHADTFEDPFNKFIPIINDSSIRYNYTLDVYKIEDSIYYDFHTLEAKDIDPSNIWHISKPIYMDSQKDTSIQLIIYKEQIM